jgi:hypothetical protein
LDRRSIFVVVLEQMTARVGGDDDAVVGDVEQPVVGFDGHGLAREVAADVVAVLEDADASMSIDAPTDDLWSRLWFRLG